VSELVESYFRTVTRPLPRTNILDMVDQLEAPAFDVNADLKEHYYRQNGI
jgi:hypothetical protein